MRFGFRTFANGLQHNSHLSNQHDSEKYQEDKERGLHGAYIQLRDGGTRGQHILDGPRLATTLGNHPSGLSSQIAQRNGEHSHPMHPWHPRQVFLIGQEQHHNKEEDAFVPGINDLLKGGYPLSDGTVALSAEEKIEKGKTAIGAFAAYRAAKAAGNEADAEVAAKVLKDNVAYFGYGYIKDVNELVPNVPLTFYMFRVMVMPGTKASILRSASSDSIFGISTRKRNGSTPSCGVCLAGFSSPNATNPAPCRPS